MEAWYATLPLIFLSDNVSHVFMWFIIDHYDDICVGRQRLPKSNDRWAYVDFTLQLMLQRRQEMTERAHNLSTANALCRQKTPS